MTKQTTYHIRRVLEYSEFFKEEKPIDIPATLKLYNRNTLVRMAAILSLHYGNMYVPDNERSLFSDCSKKHIPHINALFQSYYKRIGIIPKEKIEVVTYRTPNFVTCFYSQIQLAYTELFVTLRRPKQGGAKVFLTYYSVCM